MIPLSGKSRNAEEVQYAFENGALSNTRKDNQRRRKGYILRGGEVGKAYLELSTGKRFDVVAMADKMPARTGISTVPVLTPKELAELPRDAYDVILIAIERAEVAQAIRRDLLSLGIPANRILWESPQAKLSASGISVERLVVQLHQQEEHIRALETWRIGIDTFLLDACMERNRTRGGSYQQFIDQLLGAWHVAVSSWNPEWETVMRHYPSLFAKAPEMLPPASDWQEVDACILWGTQFAIEKNREFLRTALLQRKEIVVAEMGFLNRVAWPDPDDCFRQSVSYVFDDLAPYYDARRPSRLEQMLEDEVFHLSVAECQRASACMETIRNECLTKYNHQPLDVPSIGRPGVRKILVVDQVVGDMSISKGLANAASFRKMLETACREHPEDDIIIKTHPDNITAHLRGFYEDIQPHDHVYLLRDAVNPIALLKTCDEVYVCTSQLGMEALILKKPVHVFGMPFYAGWGLTDDYMTCPRRTHHRSLEELFYITYIRYSWYVDPRTGRPCEIEDAMDYLLQMREAYFSRS